MAIAQPITKTTRKLISALSCTAQANTRAINW